MGSEKEALKKKIKSFLQFADQHAQLADNIAEEASAKLMQAERDRGGRMSRLTMDQMIALETRACIRHAYTGYDDVLIENTLEQADLVRGEIEAVAHEKAIDEVEAFIEHHRRPAQ